MRSSEAPAWRSPSSFVTGISLGCVLNEALRGAEGERGADAQDSVARLAVPGAHDGSSVMPASAAPWPPGKNSGSIGEVARQRRQARIPPARQHAVGLGSSASGPGLDALPVADRSRDHTAYIRRHAPGERFGGELRQLGRALADTRHARAGFVQAARTIIAWTLAEGRHAPDAPGSIPMRQLANFGPSSAREHGRAAEMCP